MTEELQKKMEQLIEETPPYVNEQSSRWQIDGPMQAAWRIGLRKGFKAAVEIMQGEIAQYKEELSIVESLVRIESRKVTQLKQTLAALEEKK